MFLSIFYGKCNLLYNKTDEFESLHVSGNKLFSLARPSITSR